MEDDGLLKQCRGARQFPLEQGGQSQMMLRPGQGGGVLKSLGRVMVFGQYRQRLFEGTMHDAEEGVGAQRPGSYGALLAVGRQQAGEPVTTLTQRTHSDPIVAWPHRQGHSRLDLAGLGKTEVQAGAQVHVIEVQPNEPFHLLGTEPLRLRPSGQVEIVIAVAATHRQQLAGFDQSILPVLADRLQ